MDQTAQPQVTRRALLAGAAVGTGAIVGATGTHGVARANPGRFPEHRARELETVFTDDCTNLVAAGWGGAEPIIGAYITDHERSLGAPSEVPILPVDEGHYLFYSDMLATYHDTGFFIARRVDIGAGSWRFSIRVRTAEMMTSRDVIDTVRPRGFVIKVEAADVVGSIRRYQLRIHDQDQLTCLMASGAEQTVSFDASTPNDFHDWEISFDGLDTLIVNRDEIEVARFSAVGQVSRGNSRVELAVNGYDSVAGANVVTVDRIELVRTSNTVVVDDADAIEELWTVDPPTADAYIADHSGPGGGIESPEIAAGEYLAYAAGGSATSMTASATVTDRAWVVEFAARFDALPASPAEAGAGVGFGISVSGVNAEYQFTWCGGSAIDVLESTGGTRRIEHPAIDVEAYHLWRIGTDASGRVFVFLDGRRIAVLDDLGQRGRAVQDRTIRVWVGAGTGQDEVAVRLNYLKLVQGAESRWFNPVINGLTVLPTSDAARLETVVALHDVDPAWFTAGGLSLRWELSDGDNVVHTEQRAVTSPRVPVAVDDVGAARELSCTVTLIRDGETVASLTRLLWLPEAMTSLPAGAEATIDSGSWLFTDVASATGDDGQSAVEAGWLAADFAYEGAQAEGVFIESTSQSQSLQIPADISGWCALTVGCISGSEVVKLDVDGAQATVPIATAASADSYGAAVITEQHIGLFELTGGAITILAVPDQATRLAYLRFRSLNAEEIALAQQPDEGEAGKRMILDNDGYTQYAYRGVTTEAKLRAEVGKVTGQDAGILAYCLLGTTLTNYDSQVSIGTRESKEWMSDELWSGMLESDRTAYDNLIILNDAGVVPHAVVADEAGLQGTQVYAALRMASSKSPTYRAGLNGKKYWDFYPQYAAEEYDGTFSFRLSYYYPEYRQYILDLLVEAGSFPNLTGVSLDFCRYPQVIGWDEPMRAAYQDAYGVDPRMETTEEGVERWLRFRAATITSLLREVRDALPDRKVMVRVPRNWYLVYSLDVETWVAEGLIDVLVPSTPKYEDFWPNELQMWADLVDGTDVELYGCIESTLTGRDPTPLEDELTGRGIPVGTSIKRVGAVAYQLRTSEFYDAGFDGVYLFNNPDGRDALGLLGDKIQIKRWRAFGYPASWVTDFVETTPR